MRKKMFFMLLYIVTGAIAFAQRSDNTIALHSKFGIMKGEGTIIPSVATTSELGILWFLGEKGYFVEGNLLMQDFSIDYKEISRAVPYKLYGVNLMVGWSYEDLNPFFFNFKAGGFAGYHIVNRGNEKDEVFHTTFVNSVENITYGIVASTETEIVIWKKLTGMFSYSQYYYPMDKWIRWQYALQGGLRWYF